MSTTLLQKLTIGIAGVTALSIGLAITSAPSGFYASYGIEIGSDPNLMSELRAPGMNLAALGAVIFAGVIRPQMAHFSAALGALVFLAFALGRLVSIALDGMPESGILVALFIEIFVGGFCLLSLHRLPSSSLLGGANFRKVLRQWFLSRV